MSSSSSAQDWALFLSSSGIKKDQQKLIFFVPRARVELATPASSGLRSTAELPRLSIQLKIFSPISLRLCAPRPNPAFAGIVAGPPQCALRFGRVPLSARGGSAFG